VGEKGGKTTPRERKTEKGGEEKRDRDRLPPSTFSRGNSSHQNGGEGEKRSTVFHFLTSLAGTPREEKKKLGKGEGGEKNSRAALVPRRLTSEPPHRGTSREEKKKWLGEREREEGG